MQSTMDAVSSVDPTGTLSAINASVKLVRAAVKLAPVVQKGYHSYQQHQAGKQGAGQGAGQGGLPSNHPGAPASDTDVAGAPTNPVAPIDNEQERRAYEKVNMILKTVGERVVKSGLVDELALARALTQVTAHIEVQLFSIENNKLFQSLGNKLADPRLVNNVFTSIYLFAFLSSELEKSLPRYNGPISPGLRMVQQMFKVALGLDGFKENLQANLAAYKTLITTAAMLKPLDLDISIFRDFPSFSTSRYSSTSRGFSDKMHYKSMYEKLVKYFLERGFPQPLQRRDVGAINNWLFLTGDCNTREYVLEKVDLHLGENFGRVLYFLLCLANRTQDGTAVIAYHDQHIQLVRWLGPRFGYRVISARGDLNMAPHLQFMNAKLRAVFDTWVIIMPSQTLLQRRRTAANSVAQQHMDLAHVDRVQKMAQRHSISGPLQPTPSQTPSSTQSPDASTLSDPILQHIAQKQQERISASSRPSNPSVHSDDITSLPDSEPLTPGSGRKPVAETTANTARPPEYIGTGTAPRPVSGLYHSPVATSQISGTGPDSNHQASGASSPTDAKISAEHRPSVSFSSPPSELSQQQSGWQNSGAGRHPLNVQHRPSISSVAELSGTISGPAELADEDTFVEAPAYQQHFAESSAYQQAGPSPANPLYGRPQSNLQQQQQQQQQPHPDSQSPVASISSLSQSQSPAPGSQGVPPPPTKFRRPAPPPPRVVPAVALYDFEPEDPASGEELGFRAGDMLEIIAKTEALDVGGWCQARLKGTFTTALVPMSYLQELPQAAQAPPPLVRPARMNTAPATSGSAAPAAHGALDPAAYPGPDHGQHGGMPHAADRPFPGRDTQRPPLSSAISGASSYASHIPTPGGSATHASAHHVHGENTHLNSVPTGSSHGSHIPTPGGHGLGSTLAGVTGTIVENNVAQSHQQHAAGPPQQHAAGPPHPNGGPPPQYPPQQQAPGSSPNYTANLGGHGGPGAADEYYGGYSVGGSLTGGGAGVPTYANTTNNATFMNNNSNQQSAQPYMPGPFYPGYGPAPMSHAVPRPVGPPPAAGSYVVPAAAGIGAGAGASLGLSLAHNHETNLGGLSLAQNHENYDSSMHQNSFNLAGANINLFSGDDNDSSVQQQQQVVNQSAVIADQDIVSGTNNPALVTPGSNADYVVVDNSGGALGSPLASLAPNAGYSDTYFATTTPDASSAVSPLAGLAPQNNLGGGSVDYVDTSDVVQGSDGQGDSFYQETDTDTYVATDGMGDSYVAQDTSTVDVLQDGGGDTFVDASYSSYVESDNDDDMDF